MQNLQPYDNLHVIDYVFVYTKYVILEHGNINLDKPYIQASNDLWIYLLKILANQVLTDKYDAQDIQRLHKCIRVPGFYRQLVNSIGVQHAKEVYELLTIDTYEEDQLEVDDSEEGRFY